MLLCSGMTLIGGLKAEALVGIQGAWPEKGHRHLTEELRQKVHTTTSTTFALFVLRSRCKGMARWT